MVQKLKLISWNVNGLNSARKITCISLVKKQNCDVICLQAAHIKKAEEKFIVNKHLGEGFFSLMDKKKRYSGLREKRTEPSEGIFGQSR